MIISRNWLQTYFENELPNGKELLEILIKHSFEIEGFEEKGNDFIIDIDVLPNRAHDCLSHRGIARELSGLLNISILSDDDRYEEIKDIKKSDRKINISIQDEKKCRRYSARILENIEIKESPEWLKDRLESIGQKSINNIVDATNYLMFDIGNPIHVFDLDKLEYENIIIKNAKKGEEIITLTNEEKVLDENNLIIADEKSPLAIAGIKGGKKAEIDENTKNIVIEVANFEPVSTRKTRQKLFLMTDSSKRFENELSPELVGDAMNRISQLILEISGNENTLIGEIVDEYIEKVEEFEVRVNLKKVNKILGVEISKEEVLDILKRFNYSFEESNKDEFILKVPSERFDLRIEEDFIEEIGRIYGYDKIKDEKVDDIQYVPEVNKLIFYQNKIRNKLIEENFNEVMLYSFTKKGEVEIENPIAKDRPFLRTNLSDSLKKSLDLNFKNAELLGLDIIKIFEFGKVFKNGKEINHLALGIKNVNKKVKKEFGDENSQLVNLFSEIGKDAGIDFGKNIKLKDLVFELNLDKEIKNLQEVVDYGNVFDLKTYKDDAKFNKISQYPFVLRDISIWVPKNTSEEKIMEIIKKESGDLLTNARLIDKYEPGGEERTSFAFSLVFQSMKKTLSDGEMNLIMEKVTDSLNGNKGWKVR